MFFFVVVLNKSCVLFCPLTSGISQFSIWWVRPTFSSGQQNFTMHCRILRNTVEFRGAAESVVCCGIPLYVVRFGSITAVADQLSLLCGPVGRQDDISDSCCSRHWLNDCLCMHLWPTHSLACSEAQCLCDHWWLGGRVVSVPDSGSEEHGFESQLRRFRVAVLGKLFTSIVPRPTQPCIPLGSLNRVPASAWVKAGKSPLPGGR